MSNLTNESGLVINIPTQLKDAIDIIFKDLTKNQIDKIYFIIYKVCKEKKYQINIKDHANLLGVNDGKLTSILSKLRNNKILQTEGDYRIGAVSNSYTLVDKYNCEDENNFKLFFYPSKMKVPKWVQQYITDGYTVVNKIYSKYRNQKDKNTVLTYDQQAKLILQLQNELADLRHLVATGEVTSPSTNEVETAHVALQHAAPVTPKELPFKAVKKVEVPDTFTYTQDDIDYKINNYQKLVTVSDSDLQLKLALKKIVNLSSPKGLIVTNNKQIAIQKEVKENYIDVYVN